MSVRPLIERLKVAFGQQASKFFGRNGKQGEWNISLYQRDDRWDAIITDPEGHTATTQGHDGEKKALRALVAAVKDWKGKERIWVTTYAPEASGYGLGDMPLKFADYKITDQRWKPIPK